MRVYGHSVTSVDTIRVYGQYGHSVTSMDTFRVYGQYGHSVTSVDTQGCIDTTDAT